MSLDLIINNNTDIFSIQKAKTGYNFIKNAFKYASIPVAKDVRSICTIIPKGDIPQKCCILDNHVIQYKTLANLWQAISSKITNSSINSDDIRIYDSIVEAKNVDVSVIFKDSTTVLKYKSSADLCSSVNSILSFYTVVNSCLVFVQNIGIHTEIIYILIHDTGSRKGVSKIIPSTNITIKQIISIDKFKQMCIDPNSFTVAGLSSQLNFLTSLYSAQLDRKLRPNIDTDAKIIQKVLIIGPSGCGKTSLVKYFAALKKCGLVIVEGSSIVSAEPGKSEHILKSLFNEAINRSQEENNDVCIVLLDQIENICGVKKSSASHLKRISHQLYDLLEEISCNSGVLVIATTNNVHALDPASRRAGRLEIEIYIGTPTEKERLEILQLLCKKSKIRPSVCQKIALWTPGYVGADLAMLVREVHRTYIKNKDLYKKEAELLELFQSCIAKHRPASLRSGLGIVRSADIKLTDLGGLFNVKINLQSFVEWPLQHRKSFNRLGIPVPKGILLYGPPGCAKTSLTCAIANATNTNFLSVSAAELYSPYVGEAERNVMELFHKARINSPCIVFIDEIDALVGNRNVSSKNVQEKILSTFLIEMDGVGSKLNSFSVHKMTDARSEKPEHEGSKNTVIVIAATNRPDKLDSAILRPGRFDKLLYVGAPDVNERLDILQTITRQWKMPLAPCVELLEIAKNTENFSGADLANLIREAGLAALFQEGMATNNVKQEHMIASLHCIQPSLKNEGLKYQDMMNQMIGL
ncbi:ATPase family gene 2 protein homolog B-like [Planococcus citri]|uniref:ATPase family gene 2 protein homolog B-like n=1 Tax=Planococcus citri TaxID=170843 RepID=UPI0031FA3A8E